MNKSIYIFQEIIILLFRLSRQNTSDSDSLMKTTISLLIVCIIFVQAYSQVRIPQSKDSTKTTVFNDVQIKNFFCQACHTIASSIQHKMPSKPIFKVLQKVADVYCLTKHIQDKSVCSGAIKAMTPFLLNSLWRHYTDPHLLCHKVYMCPKQYKQRNLVDDINRILTGKPQKKWQQPTKARTITAIHVSDVHPDIFYTAGAPAKCAQPICCRSGVPTKQELDHFSKSWQNIDKQFERIIQGNVRQVPVQQSPNENAAGYWGSLNDCDLPLQTFDKFLTKIAEIKPDLIIWTGDNTAHDIWKQSQQYNLHFTEFISQRLNKVIKINNLSTIVIPAMGNHESWPVNVYDYEGERQKFLISGLAEAWKPWLTQQAYQMQKTKGYFAITLQQKFNHLKIISINTQAGNDQNWFLLRDPTDPGGMLEWIQAQLKQSQEKQQFVYIIGHIPPNDNQNLWAMRFNALVVRYSYIIRGQFFGHTHSDHLAFYPNFKNSSVDVKNEEIANVYFVAPSLTTYSDKNPEFRTMQIDFDSLQLLDYTQYSLHLQRNPKKQDNPDFEQLYSFLDTYGLQDMTLQGGLTKFRNSLRDDPQFRRKYSKWRRGGLGPGETSQAVFCDALSGPFFVQKCGNNPVKFGYQIPNGDFQKAAGPWKKLIADY